MVYYHYHQLDEFVDYLVNRGYSKHTPSGLPSTAIQYADWINKVSEWEHMTLKELNNNIGILCLKYEHDENGQLGHRSVINALKRYREFLLSQFRTLPDEDNNEKGDDRNSTLPTPPLPNNITVGSMVRHKKQYGFGKATQIDTTDGKIILHITFYTNDQKVEKVFNYPDAFDKGFLEVVNIK